MEYSPTTGTQGTCAVHVRGIRRARATLLALACVITSYVDVVVTKRERGREAKATGERQVVCPRLFSRLLGVERRIRQSRLRPSDLSGQVPAREGYESSGQAKRCIFMERRSRRKEKGAERGREGGEERKSEKKNSRMRGGG